MLGTHHKNKRLALKGRGGGVTARNRVGNAVAYPIVVYYDGSYSLANSVYRPSVCPSVYVDCGLWFQGEEQPSYSYYYDGF